MNAVICNKVQEITKISDLWFELTGKRIDSDEFDYLYDQCVNDLRLYVEQLKLKIEFRKQFMRLFNTEIG